MADLAGKVALVTGCGNSAGLGWAIALRLAHDGADVAVHGRPNAEDATRELGRLVAGFGRRALRVTADLSKETDIVKMVDTAYDHFSRIDILVNNAADTGPFKASTDLSGREWDSAIAVNLRGAFLCSREVARVMTSQGTGTIINLVSGTAPGEVPGSLIYATTKAALEAMTLSLARELEPKGIRVNALAPGFVESPVGAKLRDQADKGKRLREGTARKELGAELGGAPEDVAGAVAFLASEDARQVNGQVIRLD
ncbi:MAG: SDR family oxidoreductase [Dehalococcoidia bacterium]